MGEISENNDIFTLYGFLTTILLSIEINSIFLNITISPCPCLPIEDPFFVKSSYHVANAGIVFT